MLSTQILFEYNHKDIKNIKWVDILINLNNLYLINLNKHHLILKHFKIKEDLIQEEQVNQQIFMQEV